VIHNNHQNVISVDLPTHLRELLNFQKAYCSLNWVSACKTHTFSQIKSIQIHPAKAKKILSKQRRKIIIYFGHCLFSWSWPSHQSTKATIHSNEQFHSRMRTIQQGFWFLPFHEQCWELFFCNAPIMYPI